MSATIKDCPDLTVVVSNIKCSPENTYPIPEMVEIVIPKHFLNGQETDDFDNIIKSESIKELSTIYFLEDSTFDYKLKEEIVL